MTANISRNPGHGDSAEHFLYDPETDAYLGFVRVDKATDLRVTYLDEATSSPNPSSANGEPFADPLRIITSADDPRWIAKLVTDAHATVDDEIAHLLYRAGEASSHQEQLALSQLAAAKIAFQQLIESHYPLRWATGVPAPLTPDQVKPYEDEIGRLQERNLKQCDEIERLAGLNRQLDKRVATLLTERVGLNERADGLQQAFDGIVIQRDTRDQALRVVHDRVAGLNADNDALVVELEKHEQRNAWQAAELEKHEQRNIRLASRVSEIACERDKAQAANDRQRDTILAVREAVT